MVQGRSLASTLANTLRYSRQNICILLDSQAAIKELDNYQVSSELVWDLHQSVMKLAKHNRFQLMWVMGYEGIEETVGNLDSSENDMQDTQSLSPMNQDDLDSEIQSSASHVTPTSSSSSSFVSRKRTANTLREDILALEKKKIILIEMRLSESEIDRKLKTDDYLFLMSILSAMKKLTDIKKLHFRGQINE
ncbi:hypothetical protein B7P43_G11738 [Cryptotermes secundus]|uniref:BESS domain-containing protein n=1 Tax=Cryptotermes secundus TaxID=105785 RepID=A0A2J7QB46_9NEOP|nr:hypothetical protein B7P43_G11738 [Cryptotermes secundus]